MTPALQLVHDVCDEALWTRSKTSALDREYGGNGNTAAVSQTVRKKLWVSFGGGDVGEVFRNDRIKDGRCHTTHSPQQQGNLLRGREKWRHTAVNMERSTFSSHATEAYKGGLFRL
ncbi:hypothetical protein DPEC_G00054740 [Dallia pectoralis]|uniref:Uncharacterized protein n=1 Tax=Dallia pectoralis TaxID=75939 RepID=A0ACC2H5S2_DALPE|nr:hypothetical protein DPEC_G00054740 [Dallia pectoralis]